MDENTEELAFYDYLDAREAALEAAVGRLVANNVPTDSLRIIAGGTTNELVSLAARMVLYQRGEDWMTPT